MIVPGGRITEHAIIRYIERVIGITPDEIAEKAYPVHMANALRGIDGLIPVKDEGGEVTHRLLLRGGVAVTLFGPEPLYRGQHASSFSRPVPSKEPEAW